MMEAKFWTQTTTPQEWLLKVKSGKTWQTLKENLENDFAENPDMASKKYKDYPNEYISNADVKGYWNILHDTEDVLSVIWDDIDLTESKLQLNVVGMLAEEWLKEYYARQVVEEKPSPQVSSFHPIIQNVDEEKLMAELHKRITPSTKPSIIGETLACCYFEKKCFIKVPSQKMFEEEFPNCGNWNTIRSYFTERNRDKAKNIVLDL